jgi:hypothetical protein
LFYLISLNMDEKHDQTVAMLNDEKHPPRTRTDDNRAPLVKVIYTKKQICFLNISLIHFLIVLFKFFWFSS